MTRAMAVTEVSVGAPLNGSCRKNAVFSRRKNGSEITVMTTTSRGPWRSAKESASAKMKT